MRLDFSNLQQVSTFLLALALGAVFCLFYDVVSFFMRGYKTGGMAVFLADTLFFGMAGVITFMFFLLFSKGTIRLYVIISELLGFILFRFFLSGVVRGLLAFIQRVISCLLRLISKPIYWLFSLIGKIFNNLKKFIKKYTDKFFRSIADKTQKIKNKYRQLRKNHRPKRNKSKKVE